MLITGPKSDLTRILEAQDRAAYLPLPPSVYRHGHRVNVCPECMTEIALHKIEDYKAPWQWQCWECGWEPGIAARTTCVESLCTAVLVDGVLVGQIADQIADQIANKDASKITAWTAPVATREVEPGAEPETRDDYFDLEPPTKPDTIRPTKP